MAKGVIDTTQGVWWCADMNLETLPDDDAELKENFVKIFGHQPEHVVRETTSKGIRVFVGPVNTERTKAMRRRQREQQKTEPD